MDSLRVLTFNVRLDTDEDGTDAWPNRRDQVIGTLRYHAPDVVGLQEPLAHQLEAIDDALPAYRWVGQSRLAGEGEGEHTPIGFRTDRFSLAESKTIWLSTTPDEAGSVDWNASVPRIATWARLNDETADRPLLVCNTHLDHESGQARRKGAELIAERVAARAGDATAAVTGDLNCLAGDPPHDRLDGASLEDGRELDAAMDVAEHRHGPSTSRTDFHDLVPDRKIDHVFVSDDARVSQHAILTDRDDERYPSDHLPVAVDVER